MANLRVVHYTDPDEFLKVALPADDSFMNFALGSLLDSMDTSQASTNARWGPQERTIVAILRGDEFVISLTKIARDFSWVLSMPRDATLSAQEIEIACQMLTDFLPTIVDPETVDKIIGPAILVKPFFDIWVTQLAVRGIHLKIVDHFKEDFQDSRTTYATRETLPPPSPAFASYNVSRASEDDIIALAHLYVEFTKGAPMPATFEQGLNAMGDGVRIGRVWCCKVDGKIAGYILVGRTTPRTIAIRNVYTSPDYRRRGIAEAMVRAVTRYYLGAEPLGFEGAPDKGPDGGIKEEVNLNVADPGARRLYKRCGFLLDDDARDPRTGKIGWYASLWRGVEPVSEG